jgi:hypothetical protein
MKGLYPSFKIGLQIAGMDYEQIVRIDNFMHTKFVERNYAAFDSIVTRSKIERAALQYNSNTDRPKS